MTDPTGAPTGTVTCLFSDIEGSTQLELAIGTAAYRDVLGRHRELLREAFAANNGHERSTEGDSFFVLFGSARDGVAAAADGQRALAAERWPDGVTVRVRMGLHTGEIEAFGGDVIGYAINRTARITAAGHGGQVLLSEATRGLVADDPPDGVTLRDLGEHRLKDLREPERLTQLVIDGLPSDFPPPRSIDARPNNLPTQLTSFVGREREIAEASALLSSSRLLTLTGPGGIGKTRLSLQVAAALAEEYPGGVWFVPLEPVRDPTLVLPTIARTLGVADNSDRPALEGLAEAIGGRRTLLVLDNFEQVVGAGPDIAAILRRCPLVSIIVTTRAALRVSGEQEYPVPSLPTPPDPDRLSEVERLNLPRELRELSAEALGEFEAVRLFVARAAALRPGFALTEANAPAVAAISARLHGMPLAIELAAARIKLLGPDQILARLERHLSLLSSGSRDLPERQRTLRGAIAWSYDLLDEGSRRLLDRLSVFRGGCDLDIAELVCGPSSELGFELFDGLAALVDQSLLRTEEAAGETRFVMMDTIAEFAGEMLAARGEADVVAERHARAFLDLAETAAPHFSGDDQRAWLDRLERENDNLRAALDWATTKPEPEVAARLAFALWRFWQQRGYLNEARARFEAMAGQGWSLSAVCAARFAEGFGGVGYWQADHATAKRWYEEQLRLWREIGDRREIANALYNAAYADVLPVMGRSLEELPSEHREALTIGRARLEEALAIYRDLGDEGGEGNILWALGSYHYFTGDVASGEPWYRASLELHRKAGHRTMEAWSLHMLALTRITGGAQEEARELANQALRLFRDAGDVAGITLVLDDLAAIAVADGDPPRGGRLYGAARNLRHSTGAGLADYAEQTYASFNAPSPRSVLSEEELERLGEEVAALSLDQLVAYALEEPEPVADA